MRAKLLLAIGLTVFSLLGCGQENAGSQSVKVETEDEKTLYALGVALASNNLGVLKGHFTSEEVELIKKGFGDGLLEEEMLVDMQVYGNKLSPYLQDRMQQIQARLAGSAEERKAEGRAYLEQAAAEEGAIRTASGLVYKELRAGTGPSPQPTDKVKVHYHGTLVDGTVFDSSVERGQPASFPLNRVIPGWQEGLQMMKVGGKARLVIPSELAYEDRMMGSIPPGSTLVFEVELLDIE